MSTQRFEDELKFTKKQQNETTYFFSLMEAYSHESSKHRRAKNTHKLSSVNKKAKKQLEKYGSRLFRVLKENKLKSAKRFGDLFGEDLVEIVLNLDETTRKFPWELCFDGKDFLCTKYSVGRAVVMRNVDNLERYSGNSPLYDNALVVGLNYEDDPNEIPLENPSQRSSSGTT